MNGTQFVVDQHVSIHKILGFVAFKSFFLLRAVARAARCKFRRAARSSPRWADLQTEIGNSATYCNLSPRWRSLTLWLLAEAAPASPRQRRRRDRA